MRVFDEWMLKVRRRETPVYARLYTWAKALRGIHVPVIPGLHHVLYDERRLRHAVWHGALRLLYYEPLFKTRCEAVGRNLRVIGGLPQLLGCPVRLRIGEDVTLSGIITIVGSKNGGEPILRIGDGSYIGYRTTLVTGRGLYIGRHVLIANRVLIAADDCHPLDPLARRHHEPAEGRQIQSVWIDDDAWIGEGATVLKGVHIGRAAVVAAQAVVTQDVPPFTVVAGNPARVVKDLSGMGVAAAPPPATGAAAPGQDPAAIGKGR